MEQRCRPTNTSATGEILAAIAATAASQNQHASAIRNYGAAIEAFRKRGAPVPAELICDLASASLTGAATREARELAAQHADQCLRAAPNGLPNRTKVVQELAALHIEGLDPTHFDAPQPASVFFTAEPDKPRADAVEIEMDFPTRDVPGFADLTAGLRAASVRDSVSQCFIADWETRRQNRAEANLGLKFTTRMRDMGDYDAFEPSVEVTLKATAAEPATGTPFGNCVMRGVQSALGTGPKLNRVVAWEENVRVIAHL